MKTIKDWIVRTSNSVFTVPNNCFVDLEQIDYFNSKALIRFSSDTIDWFHFNTIKEYCGIDLYIKYEE